MANALDINETVKYAFKFKYALRAFFMSTYKPAKNGLLLELMFIIHGACDVRLLNETAVVTGQ